MNFFLDENVPLSVNKYLASKGHNSYTTRGTEKEGASDTTIFTLAQEKEAILITTDKDFFHTIPFLFNSHHGIIVINLQQPNSKNITEKAIWFLDHFDLSESSNKVVLLKDKTYTVKRT